MKKQPTTLENTETPKKKSRAPIVVLVLILLLIVLGGVGYYLLLREQPKKEVSQFLDYAKDFNLDAMASCVKDNKLDGLDENKLNSDAYQPFFQAVNKKMDYKITGLDFHMKKAEVTVKVDYFDGKETYKEAISEFFRSGMQQLFKGGDMTPKENEDLLVSILSEKAKDLPDSLTSTTLKYPCEKIDGQWVITKADDKTIDVITANFSSLTKELEESSKELDSLESDGQTADQKSETDASENESSTEDDGIIDYTCDNFTVQYDRYELAQDYSGNQCLLVYYNYTNTTDKASQPMVNVALRALQNDQACEAAFPVEDNAAMDNYMADIPAGETVSVCQSFELKDTSDVTLELSEAYSFNDDVDTQVLTIKE